MSDADAQEERRRILALLDTDRLAALERARALREHRPDDPAAIQLEAAARSLLSDYQGAVRLLEPLWLETADPLTAFNLGYCRRQTGDYAGALRLFLAALAIGDSLPIRALCADTAAILGERALAMRLLGSSVDPILAMRGRALGRPVALPAPGTREADQAILFWMKHDCHLFERLDNKAVLADLLPSGASYWPQSFALPHRKREALRAIRAAGKCLWIVKPATESGGRHIEIIEGPKAELSDATASVQALVDPPWLHHGRKLNIRLILALPAAPPQRALLWRDGLVYLSTDAYRPAAGQASAGTIVNVLRSEPARLAKPLGDLPAHVVSLTTLVKHVPSLAGLPERLGALARALVADLDKVGFWAEVRAVSTAFMPRFIGLDVGLAADGRPKLFEIERYPGMGGVAPVTARINGQFRHDWASLLEQDGRAHDRFLAIV